MKSLLENLRESLQVNECGGYIEWNSCGGENPYYYSASYRNAKKNKERKLADKGLKALSEIPEQTVIEYIGLLREEMRIKQFMDDASSTIEILRLKHEFEDSYYQALGIENVYRQLNEVIKRRGSICKTGTQTTNVLKMIALMMSEEYSEAGMDDPKLEKAFKKIIDEI
jgi:hypothetical protein